MTKEKGLIKRKIIKSNNLIESSYKLTMSENRLIDLALEKLEIIMLDKNLSAEDVKNLINCNNFEEIKINISDYAKEYSIKNNSLYKDMSEVAKKLYERSIIYIDDNDNLVTKRWVITCIYQERDCTVAIQFHPTLVPDLILLKGSFTKFDFDVKKRIKSYYGCRIYELLKQYQTFGQRIFHVDQLRFVLGVEDDEYPNYSNFKQRIIAPSIEQINKHTDLYCEFEEIKNKRKVEKIKFKFVTQKVDYSIPQNLEVLSAKEIFGDGDRNIVQEFRDLIWLS
jgi:plasmid replication initiation protein